MTCICGREHQYLETSFAVIRDGSPEECAVEWKRESEWSGL